MGNKQIEVTLDEAIKEPNKLIGELTYSCYSYNRDLGMKAERLADILGFDPELANLFENRYLQTNNK